MSDAKSCCVCSPKPQPQPTAATTSSSCCNTPARRDLLLWFSLTVVLLSYPAHLLLHDVLAPHRAFSIFVHSVFELINKMWLGLIAGMIAVGLLSHVPQSFIQSLLGNGGTLRGIFRATLAGLLLDLCNHGILLVAMQLRRKGASLGQTFAFLIASPWNSLSMTLILFALIGWKWTLTIIAASALVAIITGFCADRLHPPSQTEPDPRPNLQQVRAGFAATRYDRKYWLTSLRSAWTDSRSILKWIFFGAILAAAIRALVPPESFQAWFAPTLAGLGLTLIAATVIEVCSEGSSPLAADMVNTARAPGNGFAFLMAGAATDYTEIMALRETEGRWKRALLLPALTIPQVILIAILMNSG